MIDKKDLPPEYLAWRVSLVEALIFGGALVLTAIGFVGYVIWVSFA